VTAATATDTVVVDSSVWLEYLAQDTKAESIAPYLEGDASVLIPAIVLYEVRKILLQKQSKTLADIFWSEALKRILVPFDEDLALQAADLSISYKLAMADAIIYATALHCNAPLITCDAHFANLPGVTVV
jgi:predicted nucleic acid-binding protein